MTSITSVLEIVLPVFAALCLGMLCRAKRILSPEGVAALKKVAVSITLPAVSFGTFARADYSAGRMLAPLWTFAACIIALALGYGARRLLKMEHGLSPYLCTAFEGGMLGFSLYPLIYGDLSPFAIVVLGNTFFIFTVYKVLLSGAKGKKALLKETFTSPSLWALLLGLFIGASGLYHRMESIGVQGLFDGIQGFIAAPTSFLVLLTVGYDLKPVDIQWGETCKLLCSRYAIMALLLGATLLVNRFLLGGVIETQAAVMMFILPAPFVLPAFSKEQAEAGFLSSALSIQTVFTIVGFAIMAALAH